MAEQSVYALLGQIPIVQSIREGGDDGQPVALNSNSITGMAFAQLADNVVEAVDKRNKELPKTGIVEITRK